MEDKKKKETTNITKVSTGNLGRSYSEFFVLVFVFHKNKVVLKGKYGALS